MRSNSGATIRQEPEAPSNNETQASETECAEACRSNYPAKQWIKRPPAIYGVFLPGIEPIAGLKGPRQEPK
jgi:hypothetical protein